MSTTRAEKEFTTSTYRQWAHIKERCQEQKTKKGRILRLAIPFTMTVADYRAWVLEHFKHPAGVSRCEYCTRTVTVQTFSPDHKRALQRGGTSGLDNLAVSCADCNEMKSDMGADWFCFLLKCLWEMPDRDSASVRSRLIKAEKLASMSRRNVVRIKELETRVGAQQ